MFPGVSFEMLVRFFRGLSNGFAGFGAEGLATPKLDTHHLGPFKGVEKHICHMFPSDISHGETFIWILDFPPSHTISILHT